MDIVSRRLWRHIEIMILTLVLGTKNNGSDGATDVVEWPSISISIEMRENIDWLEAHGYVACGWSVYFALHKAKREAH